MISGYPGTVARWTSSADTVKSDELKALAEDANAYRFGEFKVVVPALSDDERCLAMRLALLPSAGSEGGWKALHDVVLQGSQARYLDALKREKLLDVSTPPSYGQTKRSEAALQCFTDDYREELREEAGSHIVRLGSRVGNTSPEGLPFVGALITLLPIATDLDLPNLPLAACRIALSLIGIQDPLAPETLLGAVETARKDGTQAAVAPLLAMGLVNTMLAMGLVNTIIDAKQGEALEGRDALLEELRQLARTYSDDAAVRERLAAGLFNTMVDAKQEEALERRDALLEELRQLARTYSDDAAVREQLAAGLFNTMVDAKQEEALEGRDALLEELRQLARTYSDDASPCASDWQGPVRHDVRCQAGRGPGAARRSAGGAPATGPHVFRRCCGARATGQGPVQDDG